MDSSVPPPSYAAATGSSTSSKPTDDNTHLQVPQGRNGIPAASRRSMEDEQRDLPHGWVRQYDTQNNHQYFVDTLAKPPRSIWTHPYDDPTFMNSLSTEERERIQEEDNSKRHHIDFDRLSTHSDEGVLPPRPGTSQAPKKKEGGLSKLKEKITGMTKEERQQLKMQQEQEEREYYERHQAFRQALQRAQMTGEPQFLGKGKDGRDIYIEPPQGPGRAYGGGYGRPQGASGYNPYSSGPYADPNARFLRPQMPYGRPYGGGYGGGLGMPLAGGMMGGMLLGGLMF